MKNEFKIILCLLTFLGVINLNAQEKASASNIETDSIPKIHIMTPSGQHIPVALTPTTTHNDLYRATQASTGAPIGDIKLMDASKEVPKDDNLNVSANSTLMAVIKPSSPAHATPAPLPAPVPVHAIPAIPAPHKMTIPTATGITLASGHNTHTSSAAEFIESLTSLDTKTRIELLEDAVKTLWH